MSKKIILLIIFGILSILIGGSLFYYQNSLKAVGTDDTNVMFVIEPGVTGKNVIDKLYEANLIKNKYTVYLYYKVNGNINLQAGTYSFNRTMDVESIFERLNNGNVVNEAVQITFVEGKRLDKYVSLIAKGFDFTEEEIYATISNSIYLNELIAKYWFLSEEILSDGIYYPLEGYLYPDTYIFSASSSIEEIFNKILDNTASKLEPYKEALTANDKYSVHDILTMASIIELEGNSSEDRKTISQVIHSRLKDNWALGMDVTAAYGAKIEQSNREWEKYLYDKNPYNTRVQDGSMNGKLPIGPIDNPSLDSIDAALNPSDTNYYWFVANSCTGDVFFQVDELEFGRKCNELKSICELN